MTEKEGKAVKFRRSQTAFLAVLLAFSLAFSLTGCMSGESGEMFALPEPPEDYQNLNAIISEIRTSIGGESIAPQSGSNTQTVQLQDLDGDGVQESAVAFFRVSGAEKPLKIYVFRLRADDTYEQRCVIEGVGNAISSVAYEDVGGAGTKEVVVSWQISATDHALGVYSLDDVEGIELLWVDSYTRFRLSDLDLDGAKEIVALTVQAGEEGLTQADYYDYDGAALALKSTVPLSAGINEIRAVRGGNLADDTPAVFVTSSFPESSDQVVDILAYRDGQLSNITLDSETLRSEETVRSYTAVSGSDINQDGVMEIPRPVAVPRAMGATDDFWLLDWRQFDLQGRPHSMMTTYHTVTDGWYFTVPEAWLDHLTISRKDSTTADERAVLFSLYQGEAQTAQPFMILYKLTGTNQTSRSTIGNRQALTTDATATYACELFPEVYDTGFTKEDVQQRFHLIRTEWSSDN